MSSTCHFVHEGRIKAATMVAGKNKNIMAVAGQLHARKLRVRGFPTAFVQRGPAERGSHEMVLEEHHGSALGSVRIGGNGQRVMHRETLCAKLGNGMGRFGERPVVLLNAANW